MIPSRSNKMPSVTKKGPGRYASHKHRPAGTKLARLAAERRLGKGQPR